MAGKEYTIVVLSSSPPAVDAFDSPRHAATGRRVAMPASSPFALSPPSSPRKHGLGALSSGSKAAPIPEKATRGFATVSSLVRSEHFAQQPNEGLAEIQQEQSRRGSEEGTGAATASTKKPRKRATKNATTVDDAKPKPKPKPRGRKPKADKDLENNPAILDSGLRLPPVRKSPFFDNVEAPAQALVEGPGEPAAEAPELTKSGKPRKPRAKKEKVDKGSTELETKKARSKRTKATAKTGKAPRVAADVVSTDIPADREQHNTACDVVDTQAEMSEKRPQGFIAEGLDLDEAVSRRRDWTPPRDTIAQRPSTPSTGKENRPMNRDPITGAFTNLVSNFTYESPTVQIANTTIPKDSLLGLTKRRRVELVELPGIQGASRASSPEKGKAPKKKPRTITDLVTGQYAVKDADIDVQGITSDVFSPHTSMIKVPLNDKTAGEKAPQAKAPRKRSKSQEGSEGGPTRAKPRSRKASSKAAAKPKPVVEKLLSPTSAVMRMNRQEVLFGTSSQLALEESPTTVRQIQQAITESEQYLGGTAHALPGPPRWPRLQRREGKRGLWQESTRNGDGGLFRNTENVYIPEPDRIADLPLLMDIVQDISRDEPSLSPAFVDIDDVEPATEAAAPIVISSDLPTPPESQSQKRSTKYMPEGIAADDIFEDIDDFENGPPPSNQNAECEASFADIDDFQSAPPSVAHHPPQDMSKSRASATARIMATGSPRKPRGRPPKAKSAIPIVPATTPLQSHKQVAPQRTPQRFPSTPPKGSGRFIDIEEILDSEDEALQSFSPTPPRVRKLQDSPPLPLAFDRDSTAEAREQVHDEFPTRIFRVLTSHLEWANIKPSVCSDITAHVRAIPPTTDPKKPSWHEKILLYDPIILEDFTAYLNTSTKVRTYKRATQKQIKAFNNDLKMRGSAILGVERDDQVLAVEKELEVYMVRDWCQELSICCIHAKESRGRGSARKGFY